MTKEMAKEFYEDGLICYVEYCMIMGIQRKVEEVDGELLYPDGAKVTCEVCNPCIKWLQ